MIKDGPAARNPDTAMRDYLRYLERRALRYSPARPAAPPPMGLMAAIESAPVVRVGDWVLAQNDTGDLIATHDDGTTRVIASREVP